MTADALPRFPERIDVRTPEEFAQGHLPGALCIPHTHVRGIGWHYEATYPDGRTEVILSVPKYDFNWQHEYVFSTPLQLPAGTKLHAKAWYDNSAANKSNPDPSKQVTWGDQTWEEMMYTSITYSFVAAPAPPAAGPVPCDASASTSASSRASLRSSSR